MEEKGEGKKESEHHVEHHSEHSEHQTNPQHEKHSIQPHHKKKLNVKRLIIVIAIILVIAMATIAALKFGLIKTAAKSEILTLDYKIYTENNQVIDEKQNVKVTSGFVASTLGFETKVLDNEIKSMNIGDSKTITLQAKDAFGDYDSSIVYEINRTEKMERKVEMNKTTEITVDRFKEIFNEEPILNKEYNITGVVWTYKVISVDSVNCKVEALAKVGDEIPGTGIEGVKRIITQVTDTKIVTMLMGEKQTMIVDSGTLDIYFDATYIYFKMNPSQDKEITLGDYTGYVTKLTEDKITIDENNPYAGKTIKIDIKLIAKEQGAVFSEKTKIPGAPTLQVFIMSYCPYGIQMLKGLLPVWKEFDDKANIELRFVSYTMHGAKEDDENARMICIREEQYSKLIPYLECFADSSDATTCMQQAGVDKAKVDSCIATKAASYMEEDKKLNTQYDVQGSPTAILDGKEAEIYPRDPQSIATALCAAFTTKPAECSQKFSTTNPSAGFGGGTGSGGGSCS